MMSRKKAKGNRGPTSAINLTKVQEIADAEFEKCFSFVKEPLWVLPSVAKLFSCDHWVIGSLADLKCQLNATKSKLDEVEIRSWRLHTTYTNKAATVLNQIRRHIKPELLTQAWCKFYEIVTRYHIVNITPGDTVFNSFHLCEAPGAFITSLNHYLQTELLGIEWQWKANSLNAYYEGNEADSVIKDDCFMRYTLPNWFFGSDNTGDIMNPAFLDDLLNELSASSAFSNLVTADGSINCQNDPSEQESTVTMLHYAEVVIALHILVPGGSLVVKFFTFFEDSTVCILYILNCVFNEVNVFKPATSKSGNSEVYVVCRGYVGRDKVHADFLSILKEHIGQKIPQQAIIPLECLPNSFLDQLHQCCLTFKNLQEKTIEENLRLWNIKSDPTWKSLDAVKDKCAEVYFQKSFLIMGGRSQPIAQHFYGMRKPTALSLKPLTGSFAERQKQRSLPWVSQLQNMKTDLAAWALENDWDTGEWLEVEAYKKQVSHIHRNYSNLSEWVTCGKPVQWIHSSMFCSSYLLTLWTTLAKNGQLAKTEQIGTNIKLAYCEPIQRFFLDYQEKSVKLVRFCPDHCNRCPESALFHYLLSLAPPETTLFQVHDRDTHLLARASALPPNPWVFLLDMSTILQNDLSLRKEQQVAMQFLRGCLFLLENLQPGDSCVLCISSALTRLTIGAIYLLSLFFARIGAFSPDNTSPVTAGQIWFLDQFTHGRAPLFRPDVVKHLTAVVQQLEKGTDVQTVLEVVPTPLLCNEPFYPYVVKANHKFVSNKLQSWVAAEEELCSNSDVQVPNDIENKNLK